MNEIHSVPLSLIDRDPSQPRIDFDSEEAMIAAAALEYSIKESGILQPILVRQHPEVSGRYMVIDGERRYRAAKHLGLDSVPVFIREFSEDDGRLAAQLFANLARRNLTQDEVTQSISRLRALGYKGADIAEKLGKTKGWVSKQERYAMDELAIELRAMGLLTSASTYSELKTLPKAAQEDVIAQHKASGTPISRTTIEAAAMNLKNFDIAGVLEGLDQEEGIVTYGPETEITRSARVPAAELIAFLKKHPDIETLEVKLEGPLKQLLS